MSHSILIYGFGNPGRMDDGLGIAMIERLEASPLKGVATESNFQLNINDAHTIAVHDTVIFVDASERITETCSFYEIHPVHEITFTTHAMSPRSVLALCVELYNKPVRAYVLEIRGYVWDFAEGLSPGAVENLDRAYEVLRAKLLELL